METEAQQPTAVQLKSAPEKWAITISWLMVPMFMPVYAMLFIFSMSELSFTPIPARIGVTLVVFAICVLVPAALILLLKFFGIVSEIALNKQKERAIPYIITILSFLAAAWFIYSRNAPMWVAMFLCGGAAAALVCMVINFRWKISAHAAAAAGVLAVLMHICHEGLPIGHPFAWLVVWTLLCGLLGASRIFLRRHTTLQVLAGYAVGFTSVVLMMLI